MTTDEKDEPEMKDQVKRGLRAAAGAHGPSSALPGREAAPCSRRAFCALAGLGGVLALTAGLVGCGETGEGDGESSQADDASDSSSDSTAARAVVKAETDSAALRDRDAIYADDDETSVVCMYLTVRQGNSGDNTDHTWEEVNAHSKYWYIEQGIDQYACEAILQVGDETGPLPEQLGYSAVVPNATVTIRGQSSTYYSQKNYKVSLKKDKGSWRDQTTINLNKHQQDGMRFRNKLAFDLLKTIPQTTACRTQFVHLYVKDETQGRDGALFEDYGLYTQVEQMNKKYLGNHGLDRYGQLYKIEYFEFYRYPEAIKLKTDPTYDQAAFEELLEVKGSDDHSKLIAMLEAVNDYSIPIEDTLATWFDVENLTYWMAFHMLVGNYDVQSRNGFLYSPQNVNRFYILSWDNDVCFSKTEWELRDKEDGLGWERGVGNYWGSVLFKRALKLPSFRAALDAAVEDLVANYVTHDTVEAMVERYRSVVEAYVYSMPDMLDTPLTQQAYDEVAAAIPDEVAQNLDSYHESLKTPMPFYIGTPELSDGTLSMDWDAAYDLEAETVSYQVALARDALFEDVIAADDTLAVPLFTCDDPGEGQYFLRVLATNEDGYTQTAFDTYVLASEDSKVYGTICFWIMDDGVIVLDAGETDSDGNTVSAGVDDDEDGDAGDSADTGGKRVGVDDSDTADAGDSADTDATGRRADEGGDA